MKNITLVNDLKNIYAENLVSVVSYGEKQDILVIFNTLEASDLKKALPVMKIRIKAKNPLPIVMSEEEWLGSADIYPIEYTEIKNNYKILYGKDVVSEIKIVKSDLRLRCEYEIKNVLVRIRQLYLGNSDNPKFMVKTLEETSLKLIRILKSALSLFDIPAPEDYSEVIRAIAQKHNFDGEIFVEILSAKESKRTFSDQKVETLVQRAINSTDALYNFINNLENLY